MPALPPSTADLPQPEPADKRCPIRSDGDRMSFGIGKQAAERSVARASMLPRGRASMQKISAGSTGGLLGGDASDGDQAGCFSTPNSFCRNPAQEASRCPVDSTGALFGIRQSVDCFP